MENTKKDLYEIELNGRTEQEALSEYLGLLEPSQDEEDAAGEIEVAFK